MKTELYRNMSAGAAALFAGSLLATPPVVVEDSVSLGQDPVSQQVTVSYELEDAPGIVTVDFLTNGVSIGAKNIGRLAGDVNKLVQPGTNVIYWHPGKSWPGNNVADENGIKAKVTVWPTNAPPDYMVIDLSGGPGNKQIPASESIRYYTCAEAVDIPGGVEGVLCKTDYLVMRKIHAAGKTFCMGAAVNSSWRPGKTVGAADSSPHVVRFTNDYYIGIYELTQQQWKHLATSNWFYFAEQGSMRPVEGVGGVRIRGYMNEADQKIWPRDGREVNSTYGGRPTAIYQLRKIAGGLLLDLPTESQWEFAARAGKCGVMPDGSPVFDADEIGKYGRVPSSPDLPEEEVAVDADTPPSQGGTAIVGSYPPNAWGLYDMFGNVAELCLDAWKAGVYYDPSVVHVEPVGPFEDASNLKYRVIRGGHWAGAWPVNGRNWININYIDGQDDTKYVGLRICLTLP